jgi:hypothetical protein
MAWFTFWDKTHTTKGGKRINVLYGMIAFAVVAWTIFYFVEKAFGPW